MRARAVVGSNVSTSQSVPQPGIVERSGRRVRTVVARVDALSTTAVVSAIALNVEPGWRAPWVAKLKLASPDVADDCIALM